MPWIVYAYHGEESGSPRPYFTYRTQREANEGASQAAEVIRRRGLGDSHFTVRWLGDHDEEAPPAEEASMKGWENYGRQSQRQTNG